MNNKNNLKKKEKIELQSGKIYNATYSKRISTTIFITVLFIKIRVFPTILLQRGNIFCHSIFKEKIQYFAQ